MTQFLAIVRRELIEARRTSGKYAGMALVFSTYLQWFIIRNYVSMAASGKGAPFTADEIVWLAPTFSLIFVAPMVIPFFANGILSRSLIREQMLGSLMPLLATGIQPGLLWAAKVVAAFLAAYVVAFAALVLDVILIMGYFHLTIAWSVPNLVVILVMAPLASIAILAVMSFLFWTVRPANMVSAFLPLAASMGLFAYASAHPVTTVLFRGIAAVAVIAVLTLGAVSLIVNKLSRKFIVGL